MSKHKWINVNFGDLLNQRKDFTIIEEGTEYPIYGVMKEGAGLLQKESVTSETTKFNKLLRLEKDNFVYRQITAYEAPSTVVLDDGAGGYVTPNTFPVFEIDTDRIMPGYLHLITQWGVFHREMAIRCAGTVLRRKTLSPKRLKEIPLLLPPVQAQREILAFMQSLDAIIQAGDREIISAEQMRVDVLKTVLTDRANEWDYTPLREVATWRSGATPKAGNPEFYHGGTIKWAKIGDVQNAPIYDTETKITEAGFEKIKKIAPVGSTLIAMYGASIGRSAFVMNEMATNQAILCGIPDEEVIVPEFLFLSALNLEDEFHRQGRGAAQPNINKTIIGDQEIPLPPLEEQEKIVEKMQALDTYLESAKRSQEALKQVRKDALHALLSGDKDVRELAEMFAVDKDVA